MSVMDTINMHEQIAEKKAALRRELRSKRRALESAEAVSASRAVCERLVELKAFSDAELILAYMASKNELDVSYAVDRAIQLGKRVAFPLCLDNGGLRLLVPNDKNAFTVGSYGILEPDPTRSVEVQPEELELIIAPAVAFDHECRRLGQGGGYYDRLFEKARCFTVGVGYDFQLVDELPFEKHDVALDTVLLPSITLENPR